MLLVRSYCYCISCGKSKTFSIRNFSGASSGIGQALAVEYAKHGTNLVIGGRNTDQLQKTKNQCIKSGLKENQVNFQMKTLRFSLFQLDYFTVTVIGCVGSWRHCRRAHPKTTCRCGH